MCSEFPHVQSTPQPGGRGDGSVHSSAYEQLLIEKAPESLFDVETTTSQLVPLSGRHEQQELRTGTTLVRIEKGIGLRLTAAGDASTEWQLRSTVAEARILAVRQACRRPLTFTLSSALTIWRIPGWIDNPDVAFRVEGRFITRRLPEVTVGEISIPSVDVKQIRPTSPTVMSGEESPRMPGADDRITTALTFACTRHPLESIVAVCAILRSLGGGDTWEFRRKHGLAEPSRQAMLDALDRARTVNGIRFARQIVRFADPACESVGECALLWILLTIAPEVPHTQFEVKVRNTSRWIDFAFPTLMIAIEFDGVGKLGTTERRVHQSSRDMLNRDVELQRLGWTVIHVTWSGLQDPAALRRRLVSLLGWQRVLVEASRRSLWREVPPELVSRNRRLGMPSVSWPVG